MIPFVQHIRANKAEQELELRCLSIELDETPTCSRPDYTQLNYKCDVNGDIEKAPVLLERRGVSSHAELWSKATLHKLSIVSKLVALGRTDLAEVLKDCHTQETCQVCNGCDRVTIFLNRCERHYCPECQPRLARERRESVEWWAKNIQQPKHVVLTCRNFEHFDRAAVQWFKVCWSKLRRRKFAANWRGGFYRLEVTNESRGWHLHLHALVDAGWIDARRLAKEWADVLGQELAIVKVKDVHSRDYMAEVTKYTVKGSQMAGWTGEQIAAFVDAFDGVKTFGVFGSLYGKRTEWRAFLDELQAGRVKCECGCEDFRYMSPDERAWQLLQREGRAGHVSLPPPERSRDLLNLHEQPRTGPEAFY